MKRIIKKVLIIAMIIIISMGVSVYAATPTLNQIANTFNNCKGVKEIAELAEGNSLSASSSGNKLTVTATTNNETIETVFTLENNILSTSLDEDDITGGIVAVYVIDCVGQLQGYEDGELFQTLNSEEAINYTLENEGLEVKHLENGKISVKIDISKKIPLVGSSNVYIEVSDLQDLKNFISGDGSAEKSKGNVWFNKSGYDGENTILVAEKDNLTDNTYKSILSIIEVMFDSSKASDYFKTNYSGLSLGNKEFSGIKVEINPTKTQFEEGLIPSDSGYKFVRISINKSLVNSTLSGNKQNTEETTNSNENTNSVKDDTAKENTNINSTKDENVVIVQASEKKNTTIKGTLPYTGLTVIPMIALIVLLINSIIVYKKYNKYKKIK